MMPMIEIVNPENELEDYEIGDYVYNVSTGDLLYICQAPPPCHRILINLSNGKWQEFGSIEQISNVLSGTAFRKLKPGTEIRITID